MAALGNQHTDGLSVSWVRIRHRLAGSSALSLVRLQPRSQLGCILAWRLTGKESLPSSFRLWAELICPEYMTEGHLQGPEATGVPHVPHHVALCTDSPQHGCLLPQDQRGKSSHSGQMELYVMSRNRRGDLPSPLPYSIGQKQDRVLSTLRAGTQKCVTRWGDLGACLCPNRHSPCAPHSTSLHESRGLFSQ